MKNRKTNRLKKQTWERLKKQRKSPVQSRGLRYKEAGELKGSITVFLSLACILFLALICAVTESARVQGAKAQSANITGMGTFSLLSEFETKLLEKYEIFALDGASGGSFQIQTVNSRFEEFISQNVNPKDGLLKSLAFDPWNLEVESTEITGYALLTDNKGEAFYQQAVSYMKSNIGVIALEELLNLANSVDEIEEKQDAYEEDQNNSNEQLSDLEDEKQERLIELESEMPESLEESAALAETTGNPLTEIAKLQKKSTLEIVTWDKTVSAKSVTRSSLPSKSSLRKGSLTIESEHSGLISNVLFREYLVRYFENYLSESSEADLNYHLEYILGGKLSDEKNLQYVVNRLLLIREGMNYAFCTGSTSMNTQAGTLATALTGFLGIPALTAATKHAILLAWAYGESLVDVRILLDGGKVPLKKNESSWSLTLENLGRVTEVLQEGAKGKEEGLSYQDYLRILLNMGSLQNQKMRALDLVQMLMSREDGMSNFQVQNCIVAVATRVTYRCAPVFLGLPEAVMGLTGADATFTQTASMAY
ncbi:MAG: DUF5702 domain-containing protein [Lachnospiraceae bacterium]|nr:DUF5702 domain-containing protein [Lachnospiraceae bacterium]